MQSYYPKDNNAILEINLKALSKNYKLIKKNLKNTTECAATVKADAYGIGAIKVVKSLIADGCKTFFVAHLSEAVELRKISRKIRIFCYHGIDKKNYLEFIKFNVIPIANSIDQLNLINMLNKKKKFNRAIAVHFDTGMSRLGLDENETNEFIVNKVKYNSIKIDLVMSHLACGDQIKHPMNTKQLDRFRIIRKHFPNSKASLANSAGIFINKKYHFDLVRPGIALYGGSPFLNSKINFHHVINLKAKVIQIRKIKKNDTIGYGATFKAKRNMYIGTIAVGYADGFNRKFSNNMNVYHGNKQLKVLGRVSMDLMTIDLTPIYTAKKYNKLMYVDVINKFNNINILSDRINTIPYEILTSLGNRYKRKYI